MANGASEGYEVTPVLRRFQFIEPKVSPKDLGVIGYVGLSPTWVLQMETPRPDELTGAMTWMMLFES